MRVLTFGELPIGSRFIALPRDGDNDGHGGLLGPHFLFMKLMSVVAALSSSPQALPENAVCLSNGTLSYMNASMPVILVV